MPDLFAHVADAWRESLGISERQALCVLAYIDEGHARHQWLELPADARERIILAFNRAIDLGAQCALAFKQAAEARDE